MITIFEDKRIFDFIEFLNEKYNTEKICLLTILNGVVSMDEQGELESAYQDYGEIGIIALTTETPERIVDGNGKDASKWYYQNYILLKLAHEYAHHLQSVDMIENPQEENENEIVANKYAHKFVKEFLEELKRELK